MVNVSENSIIGDGSIVVSTYRCGRYNPGSIPGYPNSLYSFFFFLLFFPRPFYFFLFTISPFCSSGDLSEGLSGG